VHVKTAVRDLVSDYDATLREYLARGRERCLHQAYALGRRALSAHVGLFDILAAHANTTAAVLRERPADDHQAVLDAGHTFLLEALSPFEMAHRQLGEAVEISRRLDRTREEVDGMAHALHDDVGRLLFTASGELGGLTAETSQNVNRRIEGVRVLLRQVETRLNELSRELRSTGPHHGGLVPALRFLAQSMAKWSGVVMTVVGPAEGRFGRQIELTIYRIAQEALSNVVRHAHATRATVEVSHDTRGVSCVVRDNGRGFDVEHVRRETGREPLGLVSMRERARALGGTLTVTSTAGRGTVLMIALPLGTDHVDQHPARR
jgi:signal transduction histidine kinase